MKMLYIDFKYLKSLTEHERLAFLKSLETSYKNHVKVIFGDIECTSPKIKKFLVQLRYNFDVTIQYIPITTGYEAGPDVVIIKGLIANITNGQIKESLTIISPSKVWSTLLHYTRANNVTLILEDTLK